MQIALKTPIDDETAYTGDPVEGVLLRPVKIRDARTVIPKNSVVSGVITMLQNFDQPKHHYLLSVEFERLTSGNKTYLFRAVPAVSKLEASKLSEIYGGPWPAGIQEIYKDGVFVFRAPHIHLDQRFSAGWMTQTFASAPAATSASGAR